MRYDLGNLLMMFDESCEKIIRHLEDGYPDRALMRARETRKALRKLMDHCAEHLEKEICKRI
jgi:hypothetical protein